MTASTEEKQAASAASSMAALSSKLSARISGFGSVNGKVKKVNAQVKKLRARISKLDERAARVQAVVDASSQELSVNTKVGLMSVLTGRASFDDIDSRAYLLAKVVNDQKADIEQISAQKAKLEKKVSKLEKSVQGQRKSKEKLLVKGNEVAAELEVQASMMRTHDKAAVDAFSGISTKMKGISKGLSKAKSSQTAHASARSSALAVLEKWYDLADELSGVKGALTFGAGYDFDLDEPAFVKKWGAAIGKFYAAFSSQAGFTAPLSGQGEEMAKWAYRYKIDPRLCAAVSIVESSGGQYCIKSCNAWGWGAIDSDPAGGAASWSSWSEAIKAWHKGLATSKTGMADAGSVGELGEIYCSSKDWAAKVAQYMEQISGYAN